MNNENNDTNTSVKFNYTNGAVPGSVPLTSPQQGVNTTVTPTQVVPQAQGGLVNTGIISPTPINSEVSNTTTPPTVPAGPQIVNDPTADLKTVNASTINTSLTSEPRITGTEVVSKVMQTEEKKNNNAGAMENQKLKKVEVEYKPPSKFKMAVMIFFFILILAFIIFLPEVTTFLSELKPGGDNNTSDDITTGRLVCTLDTSTSNLDKSYVRTFAFTDNKLEKVTMETITKGDIDEDANTLDNLNNRCNSIKEGVLSLNGVEVECDYRNGKLTETEVFDLNAYDYESVKAAYTEAGVDMVKYEFGEDINSIRTSMLQGGFSCEKKA